MVVAEKPILGVGVRGLCVVGIVMKQGLQAVRWHNISTKL